MLTYLGVSENPAVLERVRRWLTATYGSSISRCVETISEAESLCILHGDVRVVITDLPPGQLLRNRYDEIAAFTKGRAKIIIINNATSDIFVPSGNRTFDIVPEAHIERGLNKVLRVR